MNVSADLAVPLAGLLAEQTGAVRRVDVVGVSIPLDEGLELAADVDGQVEIARTNRGVLVRGRVTTALAETCSRCLRPASVALAIAILEEVLPSIDLATGRPLDADSEPDITRLDDHHELDLGRLIGEAISLAEPIAPLCEPDCPGLCVSCGQRLGDGHVGHEDDDIDPRLAGLIGFRVDGPGETE